MDLRFVGLPREIAWVALILGVLSGCSRPSAPIPTHDGTPATDATLSLLVVDDPAMAAAIGKLRAEWKARSGATLTVREISTPDLIAAQTLPDELDAIIYPAGQLGLLAMRDWIVPLPTDFLKSRELAWSDTFELLQVAETVWGQAPFAVPFGSPVLTCFYRADLLEQAHKRPPQTWQEYHELAEFFSHRENLGATSPPVDVAWNGATEPLAKGSAAQMLLARAAPYAKHRDHFSTLFQIDTMEPLIGGAPFVRALEEMVNDARFGPAKRLELDPAAARREFLAGHCALALSWPSHAGSNGESSDEKELAVGFVELPGSAQVYNFANKTWGNRTSQESQHTPLLGVAGRQGSLLRSSAHPDIACQLLAWFSGQEWGAEVTCVSPATTVYRRSQLRAPQAWLDPSIGVEAARQYAHSVQTALSRPAFLFALRIPGQEKYLAALDIAVEQAVGQQKPAAEALQEAAATWRDITRALGIDAQRLAYRKSVGLEP